MNQSQTKRYWWLKLQEKFFNQKPLRKLRCMAGGDTFTIIYLKMQLLSITTGGTLRFDGVEETFAEELALVIDESPDNIQFTLMFLEKHGLIEELDGGLFLLPEAARNIGSESDSADRMRRLRARKQEQVPAMLPSQCDGAVTEPLLPGDVEKTKQEEIRQDNNRQEIAAELVKFGVKTEAAIAEIMSAFEGLDILQIINYAKRNNLRPGWLRAAVNNPDLLPARELLERRKYIPTPTPMPEVSGHENDGPLSHGFMTEMQRRGNRKAAAAAAEVLAAEAGQE